MIGQEIKNPYTVEVYNEQRELVLDAHFPDIDQAYKAAAAIKNTRAEDYKEIRIYRADKKGLGGRMSSKEMDYSHLSQPECVFLAAAYENKLNDSKEPIYTRIHDSIRYLISTVDSLEPKLLEELKMLVIELHFFEMYLLKNSAALPCGSDFAKIIEECTSKDITDGILSVASMNFMVGLLQQWRQAVEMRIAVIESGVSGAGEVNATIN